MRATARLFSICGLASLLAVLGSALLATGAVAQPTGTPPAISPATDSTTTSPQVGDVLTEVPATWSGTPMTTSIQWYDCDSSGNNCIAIFDATGLAGSTYTVAASDVGFTIEVWETDIDNNGTTMLPSGPTLLVPGNTAPPTITGVSQQGQTLTAISGTWNPGATSFGYQWLDCDSSGNNCTSIVGATGPTYLLTTDRLLGDTVRVQENANSSSVPADSAPTAVISLNPSSTDLLAAPGSPVTNQPVTLIATVTSSFALAPPAGSVSFDDGGTLIAGCSAVSVSTVNQSVPVTCVATFSAATAPSALTAIFTPDLGAGIAGSTSPTLSLPVGEASTSTTLDVSNPTVFAGSTATYTVTVTTGQGEPVQPSGAVQFSDNATPIASCSSQTLVQINGSLSAQCLVRYQKSGRHTIAAQYGGDANFSGSASSSQAVKVQLRPIRIGGTISAETFWTDYFTPTYTQFLAMVVHKLRLGTTIVLICRGQGCPFARQSLVVTAKACGPKAGCVTEKSQVVDLLPRLRADKLRVGTVLTVELTRPDWIGKAYVISIRSGRRPSDRIQCLAPGSTRPGVGC